VEDIQKLSKNELNKLYKILDENIINLIQWKTWAEHDYKHTSELSNIMTFISWILGAFTVAAFAILYIVLVWGEKNQSNGVIVKAAMQIFAYLGASVYVVRNIAIFRVNSPEESHYRNSFFACVIVFLVEIICGCVVIGIQTVTNYSVSITVIITADIIALVLLFSINAWVRFEVDRCSKQFVGDLETVREILAKLDLLLPSVNDRQKRAREDLDNPNYFSQ